MNDRFAPGSIIRIRKDTTCWVRFPSPSSTWESYDIDRLALVVASRYMRQSTIMMLLVIIDNVTRWVNQNYCMGLSEAELAGDRVRHQFTVKDG